MASKGESKTQKKLSVSKVRKLPRKGKRRFTHRSRPGAHSKDTSVPLVFALRDILGIAQNAGEAKKIANSGSIKVNDEVRKEIAFNVGLFDTLEVVPEKKRYRTVFDRHGRIKLVEIPAKGGAAKLCKVAKKHTIKKGVFQITTDDGATFTEKKTQLKVGDSIKVELPGRKVVASYPLRKGNLVYITGGLHVGTLAKISDILEGTMSRPRLVSLESGGEKFLTVDRNVFVVGEKKSEIELGMDEEAKEK